MTLVTIAITITLTVVLQVIPRSSGQVEENYYPSRDNNLSYNWTCQCHVRRYSKDKDQDDHEDGYDNTRIWETPADGIYLFSLEVNQKGKTNSDTICPANQLSREADKCNGSPVRINFAKRHLILSTHTGNHSRMSFGDVTVTLTLKKGNMVIIDGCCSQIEEPQSHVFIVLVSRLVGGHALTRQVPTPISVNNSTQRDYGFLEPVQFNRVITHHNFVHRTNSEFVVPVSGIYWVTLRAHVSNYIPIGLRASMSVHQDKGKELLMAECDAVNQGTGAAAFWLGHGSVLTVKLRNLQALGSDTRLDPWEASAQTMLSVVYLEGNSMRNGEFKMRYVAYTGLSEYEGVMPAEDEMSSEVQAISFASALTDFGNLTENRYIKIKTSGTYLVSVRAVPSQGHNRTRLTVMLNQGRHMDVYPQGAVAGTHTFAQEQTAGDLLAVYADRHSYVERMTMLSVALVQPNDPPLAECGTKETRPCSWE